MKLHWIALGLLCIIATPRLQAQDLEKDMMTARAGGKYQQLLHVLRQEADARRYGDFHDFGHWTGKTYAGHENLPAGYWVYVRPSWFIWGRRTSDVGGVESTIDIRRALTNRSIRVPAFCASVELPLEVSCDELPSRSVFWPVPELYCPANPVVHVGDLCERLTT